MTPLEYMQSKISAHRNAWNRPEDQLAAALLCDLLEEMAIRFDSHAKPPMAADESWRHQVSMLQSGLLDWLISFSVSRFGDPRTTDQNRIRDTLAHRIELYREMNTEKAA
jgi:hypothetical protein